MDVQVFKLNSCDRSWRNEFVFLIRKPGKESVTDPYSFPFEAGRLSSRASMEELYIQAAESTKQFRIPGNVKRCAAVVSDYLADNFELDLTAKELVVIVVGLDRSFAGVLASKPNYHLPVILNGRPSWVIDKYEKVILPSLKHPIISLRRVPALKEFEGSGGDWSSCAICLEAADASMMRKMPCNHIFHGRCIARWLWIKTSCPICRSRLS